MNKPFRQDCTIVTTGYRSTYQRTMVTRQMAKYVEVINGEGRVFRFRGKAEPGAKLHERGGSAWNRDMLVMDLCEENFRQQEMADRHYRAVCKLKKYLEDYGRSVSDPEITAKLEAAAEALGL